MGDLLSVHEGRTRPYLTSFYDRNGISKFYDGAVIDGQGLRNVPKLILGTLADIKLGDEYVPCDYKREPTSLRLNQRRRGLAQFVRLEKNGIPVYVVDEHHHALWMWCEALKMKIIQPHSQALHIDSHDDYRSAYRRGFPMMMNDLAAMRRFVVDSQNEGSFMDPALSGGLLQGSYWINPNGGIEQFAEPGYKSFGLTWSGIREFFRPYRKGQRILDIDVDYFEPGYWSEAVKEQWAKGYPRPADFFDREIRFVRSLIPKADVVTISIPTDRRNMDPEKGIEVARKLLA